MSQEKEPSAKNRLSTKYDSETVQEILHVLQMAIQRVHQQEQREQQSLLDTLTKQCEQATPQTNKEKIAVAGKCLDLVEKKYAKGNQDESVLNKVYLWFKKSCEYGSLYACCQQGLMLAYLKGSDSASGQEWIQDYVHRFEKQCAEGNGIACSEIAKYLILSGQVGKAFGFFDKACAQNEDEACHNAGVADYNQKGSNFFNYFTKGCNLNNPVSCDYLAKCHLQGNGTNPDPYTGFKVAEKASTLGACDPDDDMNLWLSSIHELGKRWSLLKSTRTNMRMAVKFAVRSCNCGFATGCFKAAYIYDKGEGNVERDVESASEYYEKACAKGFLEGCEQLYFLLKDGTTPTVTKH